MKRLAVCVLAVAGLAACGGGSSGPPKSLSVSGLHIPTSQIVSAVQSMCAVATQAHSDPAGSQAAFFNGPQASLHELVAAIRGNHRTESDALLKAISAYEVDLGKSPPPASTGGDADEVVQSAQVALRAVNVTPPTCS